MVLKHLEVRSSNWVDAAKKLIAALKKKGVVNGQIRYIDAHNNGNGFTADAIFCAFYEDYASEETELNVNFWSQNDKSSWEDFYKNAQKAVDEINPSGLISITGSCNVSAGVMFAFSYGNAQKCDKQKMGYVEARSSSWDQAARDIITKLKNEGVMSGQVVNIDAHSNGGSRSKAIFHAFYNKSLKARGKLGLQFVKKDDSSSWESHYQWVLKNVKDDMDIHGITSSTCNTSVTYIFYSTDTVVDVQYDLAKISKKEKTKVLASQTNTNRTSNVTKFNVSFAEAVTETAHWQHELGLSVKAGTEFECGLPFIGDAKASIDVTGNYAHTWGTQTEKKRKVKTDVEVVAKPGTKVVATLTIKHCEHSVPFKMTWKSGRVTHGRVSQTQVYNEDVNQQEYML